MSGVRYPDRALPDAEARNMRRVEDWSIETDPVGRMCGYVTGAADPPGWMVCDGRAISRVEFRRLFSIIGTTFGTGDGSTTFNIPNPTAPFTNGKWIIRVL